MSSTLHPAGVAQAGEPMTAALPEELTALLLAWSKGDPEALQDLMPLVSNDLRVMARRYLAREGDRHILQPTALVNEFFLKVNDRRSVQWENRAHFFGFAAQTMRLILVDFARHQKRAKRGGGEHPMMLGPELDDIAGPDPPSRVEILALHQALDRLEAQDPRMASVVKLRYFVGMTVQETAAALELSPATVKREWQFARLWLFRELNGDGNPSP